MEVGRQMNGFEGVKGVSLNSMHREGILIRGCRKDSDELKDVYILSFVLVVYCTLALFTHLNIIYALAESHVVAAMW